LVIERMSVTATRAILATFALFVVVSASAQTLYKYRGENGEWIYSDRPPDDGLVDEVRDLKSPSEKGTVSVTATVVGRSVRFEASNGYHIPMQLALRFTSIKGLQFPATEASLVWVLPPVSNTTVLRLDMLENGTPPGAEYEYEYMPGDPEASHQAGNHYRVPFAIASDFQITQAYPDVVTHTTADSYHAIDIAMPIGTDVFAARGGVVFAVATDNFKNGLDPKKDGSAANVVQILHDDGTYALYAHLNWNSIRVQPGDRVSRGQYIAESGNTGFSTGPHLHFAVLRNAGMRVESVPIRFEGANAAAIVPASGNLLTAY